MPVRSLIVLAAREATKQMRGRLKAVLYVVFGLALGYFGFCKLELDIRRDSPETWAIIWGASHISAEVRCMMLCAAGIAVVLVAVFVGRFLHTLRESGQSNR